MRPGIKRTFLVLSVVGLLALVWFAPSDEDGISAPAVDKSKRSRKATAAVAPSPTRTGTARRARTSALANVKAGQLANQERTPLAENIPDLFAGISWYVPPPPPPPEPPPPPTAPPLPFVFLGQYIEDDTQLILLTRGDRMLRVSVGEVIDRTYKVARLEGGQLTFIYLPLKVEQSLNTGIPQ
ncbi:hypothetical protein [Propionivibrio sp.]|uniref:hypothetical protein n=1 Tax=Propionivibrio sp. TaxID=2212460 RepID=UPI003BF1AF01